MSFTIKSIGGRELYVAQSATDVRAAVIEAVKARANLARAYLVGANLARANLARANLADADLADANLARANLAHANLARAKNAGIAIAITRILPDEGPIIGWKKARDGRIVKLEITSDAKRSHAMGRKCRADKAIVLAIYDRDGTEHAEAVSCYDHRFVYRFGETITPTTPFDEDMWNECSTGIHFYVTRLEAEHHD